MFLGRLAMTSRISLVNLLAPTGPSPLDTMVILDAFENGPLISDATRGRT